MLTIAFWLFIGGPLCCMAIGVVLNAAIKFADKLKAWGIIS